MIAQMSYPVIDLAATGRCIERQRRQAGLTVKELQSYFGFEYPQAIYKWQHGECLPTVDNLLALSRVLQVKMEDLLVYEDQEVFHFYTHAIKQTENQTICRAVYAEVLNYPFRIISTSSIFTAASSFLLFSYQLSKNQSNISHRRSRSV